jgi:hypothetical protein
MGAVGTAADNAMMESFWGRLQVELFNRRRWKTRIELANATRSTTTSCSTTPDAGTPRSECAPPPRSKPHGPTAKTAWSLKRASLSPIVQ